MGNIFWIVKLINIYTMSMCSISLCVIRYSLTRFITWLSDQFLAIPRVNNSIKLSRAHVSTGQVIVCILKCSRSCLTVNILTLHIQPISIHTIIMNERQALSPPDVW